MAKLPEVLGPSQPPASVPALDEQALVDGNNAFAFDLYQALRSPGGNLAFSPYGLAQAAAVVYAGARGRTEAQMAETLHYTLPQERLHAAFSRLRDSLRRPSPVVPGEPKATLERLEIASAIWTDRTYPLLSDYVETVAQNYDPDIHILTGSFVDDSDGVRQQMNDWIDQQYWVHQQANAPIREIVRARAINPATRMAITDAIHYRATWLEPFPTERTHVAPFHLLSGAQAPSYQMTQHCKTTQFYAGLGYHAVRLS